MKLSEQQLRFFETFGYLVLPKLFSPADMARITDGFEASIQMCGGGKKRAGSAGGTVFFGPIEHRPQMCELLDDPRILGLVGGVIGDDFNYASGDGNYYSGDTMWHSDGYWGELFAVKVAFYLDPVRRDSGALRVIPGTHDPRHPLRKEGGIGRENPIHPHNSLEQYGVHTRDYPGNVALESDPGDVVLFNHNLFHSAWGGSDRRRMFTMNCIRRGKDPRTLDMVRAYLKSVASHGYVTEAGFYFAPILDTATPARMMHLEQPAALYAEMYPNLTHRQLQPG